jgi:Aspartyl protease
MEHAFGLLDTGADETKLPMEMARRLRIEIDPSEPARFRGIAGQQARGFYGKEVSFELKQGKRSYRWMVPRVAFLYDSPGSSDDERALITLGHVGFFRFFHVGLDYQRGRVSIRPNGLFRPHMG